MNLKDLRELAKTLEIKKAHVKGAETLVKEINEIHELEGKPLVEFSDVPTVDGIEIPQGIDPAIAAAIVSTKLNRKLDKEEKEVEKNKSEKNLKLTYEERARKAAQQALINPHIESYIYNDNSTVLAHKTRQQATRKVRVIVTVMDPARQVKFGEIFRVRNAYTGTVAEMVAYNEHPQHLSQIIINALREIQYNKFVADDSHGKRMKVKKQQFASAFRIQELPHLTPEELEELKRTQQSRAARVEG